MSIHFSKPFPLWKVKIVELQYSLRIKRLFDIFFNVENLFFKLGVLLFWKAIFKYTRFRVITYHKL